MPFRRRCSGGSAPRDGVRPVSGGAHGRLRPVGYTGAGAVEVGLGELDRLYHPAGFVLSPVWNGPLIAVLRELEADEP